MLNVHWRGSGNRDDHRACLKEYEIDHVLMMHETCLYKQAIFLVPWSEHV